MPTGSDFALVTDKKLLGVRDFDLWLLKYLRDYIGQSVKRLFIQGSFEERMPLSSPGDGQIQVDPKPTIADGIAHDGAGHILDLEAISTVADFANVTGQQYEVGASYVEYPVGIRTNPRNGKFEYDRMREGIGVQAQPDEMTVDPSTLTFVVDALFEQGVTVSDHSGRQVRVFLIVPGDAASDDSLAIETCTVFYDGQNKITTDGWLGQSAPANNASVYFVQLIGVTVLMNTATNAPSQLPESVFFIGTVEGNDATPDTFDITGQQVIQAQSADMITVDPLGDWADGTTNPGGFVQGVLEKIVSDLTSTTGEYGAGKLTVADLPDWFNGVTNPAATLATSLAKLVSDLADITGDGSFSGAQKVSAIALGNWADATLNEFGSVQDLLANIVAALTSTTDARGAGKITAPALPDWADGTTNPPARVDEALVKIVTDLATGAGTSKIMGSDPFGPLTPFTLGDEPLLTQLYTLVFSLNATAINTERCIEFAAIRNLKPVYTIASAGEFKDIAAEHTDGDPNSAIESMLAVGGSSLSNVSTIARFTPGQAWLPLAAASGFVEGFNGVAHGTNGYALVGNDGEIQSYTSGVVTRRKTGGNHLTAVAFMGVFFVAVGDNGHIWLSTNNSSWTQQTPPAGMESDAFGAIATDGGLFVVTTRTGAKIMTSPDGQNWTQQASGTLSSTSYLTRQLQWSSRFGFVALRLTTGGSLGVSQSDDGITWNHRVTKSSPVVTESGFVLSLLDRQVAYFHNSSGAFSAIVAEDISDTPMPAQNVVHQEIFHIATGIPLTAKAIRGNLYVLGSVSGDAAILSSAPFRPNSIQSL